MAEMLSGQVSTLTLTDYVKKISKCAVFMSVLKVLFPGKGPIDHMQLLLEVVGTPSDDVLKKMISKDVRPMPLKCHTSISRFLCIKL